MLKNTYALKPQNESHYQVTSAVTLTSRYLPNNTNKKTPFCWRIELLLTKLPGQYCNLTVTHSSNAQQHKHHKHHKHHTVH